MTVTNYEELSVRGDNAEPECRLYRLGQVSYEAAWQWQKTLFNARRQTPDRSDALLLLEHFPVYTLGQGADERFITAASDARMAPIFRIERGGEVTYHCPGQLVGYPILNLRRHRPDLHWYLRQLEEVLISTLAVFGLPGERIDGLTGVWIDGRKVAAIGIKVSRWITMHGFSLNVCPDMAGFRHIVPCGIADKPVGRLSDFRADLTVETVQAVLEQQFAQLFHCRLIDSDITSLPDR